MFGSNSIPILMAFAGLLAGGLMLAAGLFKRPEVQRRWALSGFFMWCGALVALAGYVWAQVHPRHALALLSSIPFLFGLVTLNWLWPATGAVTPPAGTGNNQDSATVDVTTDGTATTVTLTHNLNISAADITAGWPDINIESNGPTGIPATVLIDITRPVSANAVVLTFAAVVATFRVKIKRPHTIGR